MALLSMLVLAFTGARSMYEIGVDRGAFVRGRWVLIPVLALALIMLGIAHVSGTLHANTNNYLPGIRTLLYAVWALEQEFMLESFLFVSFERAFGTRWAIFCATTLFVLAHLPNPALVVATAVGGLVFTTTFARYRNLYVVSIAHLVLGLTFALTVPDSMHHHMRVGWGYSRYTPSLPRGVTAPPLPQPSHPSR